MRVHEDVRHYLVQVARATRSDPDVRLGASPRATLALHRASQTWAAMQGRDFVVPDDVKYLAVPVLAHRLIASLEAQKPVETHAMAVVAAVHQAPPSGCGASDGPSPPVASPP